MNWSELYEFLNQYHGADWWEDSVTVYDQEQGEFFPCETIEFTEDDDIIDAGSLFLSIKGYENE